MLHSCRDKSECKESRQLYAQHGWDGEPAKRTPVMHLHGSADKDAPEHGTDVPHLASGNSQIRHGVVEESNAQPVPANATATADLGVTTDADLPSALPKPTGS